MSCYLLQFVLLIHGDALAQEDGESHQRSWPKGTGTHCLPLSSRFAQPFTTFD